MIASRFLVRDWDRVSVPIGRSGGDKSGYRTATPRVAAGLNLARAGIGVTVLLFPGLAVGQRTARSLDGRARSVVRLLGARHVAQAAGAGAYPTPAVIALGAEVDVAHAVTMAALGLFGRGWRSDAHADVIVAAALAIIGAAAAGAGGQRFVRAQVRWLRRRTAAAW